MRRAVLTVFTRLGSVAAPGVVSAISEETPMSASTTTIPRAVHQTPYEYRLALVSAVLQDQAGLKATKARDAAVLVLHSIDTIPEHVR